MWIYEVIRTFIQNNISPDLENANMEIELTF